MGCGLEGQVFAMAHSLLTRNNCLASCKLGAVQCRHREVAQVIELGGHCRDVGDRRASSLGAMPA